MTQLLATAIPFVILYAAMWFALQSGYWFALVLTLPAGGLLVRFFIIQHDCGHGSFFRSRLANDMMGRAMSVMTLVPYSNWRKTHATHHATSGNLGKRGTGDIYVMTVKEFNALSPGRRRMYRVYRHPLFLLFLGSPYLFLLSYRIPFGAPVSHNSAWPGIVMLNFSLIIFYGLLGQAIGWMDMLLISVPTTLISTWIGGWLFYVQHQFTDTDWESSDNWDFHEAAIRGSSYYVLPKFLQWYTGNIGLHHIHHLNGKIPNYRLQECLDAGPEPEGLTRITLIESLKCLRLALWDEESRKLISFRQAATA